MHFALKQYSVSISLEYIYTLCLDNKDSEINPAGGGGGGGGGRVRAGDICYIVSYTATTALHTYGMHRGSYTRGHFT